MSENKKQCYYSIEILNELLLDRTQQFFKGINKKYINLMLNEVKLSIKIHGSNPQWKTIWKGNSSFSEGFASWKEVRIYLSGMRGLLKLL
jgi:hypothetical protein